MDEKFKPQNIVQRFAKERRGITSLPEFEKKIGSDPWNVARVTARYWWENGVPEKMMLANAKKLADFLYVKIDDFAQETK